MRKFSATKTSSQELSQLRQELNSICRELGSLLPVFLDRKPLLKAYVADRRLTCGNPNCHCSKGELHDACVITIPTGPKSVNRSVPAAKREELQQLTENYRSFRQARADWNKLHTRARQVLNEIEGLSRVELDDDLCVIKKGGEKKE